MGRRKDNKEKQRSEEKGGRKGRSLTRSARSRDRISGASRIPTPLSIVITVAKIRR